MKKVLSLVLTSALMLSLVACSNQGNTSDDNKSAGGQTTESKPAEGKKIKVGFVTDTGGIDDKSFNQTSYGGIQQAAKELGLKEGEDFKYTQSSKETDYIPNLSAFAEEGVDLVVAAGYLFSDSITKLTEQYPEQKTLIIDVDWLKGENLQQAVFAEHEGSYLVGIAAGLKAKKAGKNKVGIVIGDESVTMNKFTSGYQAGVWSVCPECEIHYDSAKAFDSPEKGKTLAAKQFNAGVYVVYQAAGATGIGVIQEGASRRDKGEDVWVIGVDTDQYHFGVYGKEGKSVILTSMLKRVDIASANAVKAVANGTFKGGVVRYTLKDGGVDIPAENPNLEPEIVKAVQEAKQKIIAGEVKVPEEPVTKKDDKRVK